ncbi:hypothetical protein L7F22_050380 [Adiantum nelumboides]|nr:hypothetical protein [Adiantum nelumboides]
MDGNKEEGSSSEDRQLIPTAHEIGESSGQAEKALQVVTAVTMFKQLMENPRFMEFIQSSSIAHQVQGSFGMPRTAFRGMQNMVPNPMYANIGMQLGFWGTQGQFGVSQGNLGMAGFSIPPVNTCHKATWVYMARCLANIKEGSLVIPSLRLLRDFIWLDHEKPLYQMCLQQLIKDHDLLNMVVSSLEKYMAGARIVFSANGSESISIEVLNPFYSHDEQLKERLEFLLFILRSSGLILSWSSTERLWNCMIEVPACEGDKESGFCWFCEALDKWSLITLDAQTNLLTKKLSMIDPSSLSQAAWRCFLKLFLSVNQSKDKLKLTPLEEPVTLDLDLVGLPYLWWIALCSSQGPIVEQSISLLREIHTSLSDTLQENIVEIRQRFIDKCLEFLEKALEVGGVKWSEGSDCSSTASCSMGEGTSDGTEKLDDRDSLMSKMAEGDLVPERRGLDIDSTFCSEAHQVEHCLRILKIFVTKCEGRCLRSIPPHTASFQGRPFILGVSTANKQSTRFDATVHSNEYLSSLRAKVAKLLDQPCSQIRLTYQNRDLLLDSQVLWQCGLVGGQTITASVNLIERVTKFPDEQQLPGVLISKNLKFYDTLFRLATASDTSVREGANSLLALLPTHPAILAGFQELCTKSAEEGRSLLAAHFGARDRLLYTLQVLDGLVMPVNRPIDLQTLKFRTSFIQAGGVQHLLTILEPEALPEGIDNQTRRGCYASSLRLLKFLLSEKFDCDDSSVPVSEVTDAVRDNGVTQNQETMDKLSEGSAVSPQPRKGLLEKQGVKELSEVVDMASVVAALRRITWAAAAGQLSSMGSCSSVVSVPKVPSGKSAKKRSFPDDDDGGLDPEDQYLCFEAMDFLMLCLLRHKYLWRLFFTSCDTEHFIVAVLLHSPDNSVRYQAASNLMKLCATKHGSDRVAHKHVLAGLLGAKAEATRHPKRCSHFWDLVAHLFCTIEDAEDRELAQQQLEDELQWLQSAPSAVDDDDRLLEGHLHLVKVLVDVLDCRIIGASKVPQGRGLIKLLIRDFLFPDCAILLHEDDGLSPGKVHAVEARLGICGVMSGESRLLHAKCSTRGSRERAFQLLICLAKHCRESFQEAVDLIKRIHLAEQVADWEHLPSYGRKALGGYVGLKNAGATCYMNSVFQQLFMQPEVRRSVLACTECDDVEKSGSVFFQLQAMFGALLGSSLDHYTPQGFWCAYRDYDGMPINLREHQDAFEFFNRLYDSIDETLKATHQETTLTRIFGGVFAQQIICRGCPHRSEREEPFAAISVDVKNKRDLTESLEAFVRGDLLEGDNAYHCAECGVKVDALKRVCVKSLPHTLVIHLKRFDFDYETMQRLKLKDRFEFPTHIDMKPYTVEGLALRETQTHSVLSPKGVIETSDMANKMDDATFLLKPDSYYHYDLVGVVVHSGTAFAGHYYSYIKQRPGDHPLNCGHGHSGGWIAFDDKNVEPYDAKDLEKDCFGGRYTVDVYDNFSKTTAPQEFDRPNSAYMLLYERSSVEPVSACSPAQTAMSLSRAEDEDGDEPMKEISLCDRLPSLSNIQMPASVHRSVWQENLRFIHENHLMDKDYFRFILRLVEINCDLLDSRGVSVNEHLEGVQSACNPRDGEAGALEAAKANEFAKAMTTLATEFLLKIYLRTHSSLREDLVLWKSLLDKLFERSRIACQTFIEALVEHPHWVQDYLVKCPVEEIQQFFASMLLKALCCTVKLLHGTSIHGGAHVRATDPLHVNALIDILLSFLRDPTLPKYSCYQYFQVLIHYANLGPAQRFYLLNKSALSLLVNTTVIFASKVNLQIAKLDYGCLHSLVSLLLRSCDISQLQNISGSDLEKMSSESEEIVDTAKPSPSPSSSNPFQLPPPHFLLPKEAIDAAFKQHMYLAVLIETCPEYEEAVKLLGFLCWNNESFTLWLLKELLGSIHRSANSDAKPVLALVLRILVLEDSLQKLRQKVFLLGHENIEPGGIMSLIVTRVMSIQKRYMLLKFLVKLLSKCPDTKLYVRERASDWKRVVDWLQDEIQAHGLGSNAMITLSVSNEDMSNGQLQRTSSAEWTLVNARSFCES